MYNPIIDMPRVMRDLPQEAKAAIRRCKSKAELRAVFEEHVIAKEDSGATKDSDAWRKNAVRALFHEKPVLTPTEEAPKAPPAPRNQPAKVVKTAGTTTGTAWAPPPPEQGQTRRIGTAWKGPAK
jgi:hypothetical protein